MSTTAEAIQVHFPSNGNSRNPSRCRSAGAVAPVTIEAMDEPKIASELHSTEAEVPAESLARRLNTAMLAGMVGLAQLCAMAAWPWPFAAIVLIQNPA